MHDIALFKHFQLGMNSRAGRLLGRERDGIAFDFTDGQYGSMVIRDTGSVTNGFAGLPKDKMTYTSPSAKWVMNSGGILESASTLRVDYSTAGVAQGLLCEAQATNNCLWSDDLTNAAWIATTMTTAMTATGVDGVANSATTLTATAGNAMVLQTLAVGSSTRITSCFIKRRTGSGTVQITQDAGGTWTTVTVTAGWTRVECPSATVASPVVGVRLVTNADAVDVQFFQHEIAAFPSSPIRTTTATVTRSADQISLLQSLFPVGADNTLFLDNIPTNATTGTYLDVGTLFQAGGAGGIYCSGGSIVQFDHTGTTQCSSSTGVSAVRNTQNVIAARYRDNDFAVVQKGGSLVFDTSGTSFTKNTAQPMQLSGNSFGGAYPTMWLRRAMALPRGLANAQLQELVLSPT